MSVHGHDPDGNPRTIPVQARPGLIVWHSQQEWDRYMAGVDVEAARLLTDRPKGDER